MDPTNWIHWAMITGALAAVVILIWCASGMPQLVEIARIRFSDLDIRDLHAFRANIRQALRRGAGGERVDLDGRVDDIVWSEEAMLTLAERFPHGYLLRQVVGLRPDKALMIGAAAGNLILVKMAVEILDLVGIITESDLRSAEDLAARKGGEALEFLRGKIEEVSLRNRGVLPEARGANQPAPDPANSRGSRSLGDAGPRDM